MLNREQIERATRRLLHEVGIQNPPVPVEKLARHLGASIRYQAGESDISGALYREHGVPLIGVNASHSRTRQRFTIAHELGHLSLHDDPIHVDHHYVSETGTKVRYRPLRSSLSSEGRDPREIEANRFAAALLMPRQFLQSDLRNLEPPLKEPEVVELATLYQVSVQAMVFRLDNLGVAIDV